MTTEAEPVTIDEIASVDFKSVKTYFTIPEDQRLHNADVLIDQIRPMAILAVELFAFDKLELIAKVSSAPDLWGFCLTALGETTDALKALQDIVGAAEARMTIALANIEGVRDPAATQSEWA
jgi:hypothetical protein